MTLINSIILGIIQGLTEFLPVSSSGHLVIVQDLVNVSEPGVVFEIVVHVGSLLAVLIYFSKDIFSIVMSCFKLFSKNKTSQDDNNIRVATYIIIATAVTAVITLFFKDYFESLYQLPLIVAILLFINGFIIFASDRMPSGKLPDNNIGFVKSMFIGLGQALAVMPGISRSGTTISFSLFSGMKRSDAARFSFLLSIPAILGAAVLKLDEIQAISPDVLKIYLAGAVSSFISGLLVITLLLQLIKKKKLMYFSIYCWIFSIIYIIYFLTVR